MSSPKSQVCNIWLAILSIARANEGSQNLTLDWGVEGNTEFATGLTLIAERLAAANANDVSRLDKKTLIISSRAIFFKHNIPWYCDVTDYEIHPDFNNSTLLNTLALLYLDCNGKTWTPINWTYPKRVWKNIYAVGLSDQNYEFEQKFFRMKFVNSSACLNFYIDQEINFKNLWPKHFLCLKALDIKRQCVFDSGMALVSVNHGNWTLIGISVLGPGCVLPSRYIDIISYIPWMDKQKSKYLASHRRQFEDDIVDDDSGSKSDSDDENIHNYFTKNNNSTAIDPSANIVSDVSFIEDDFYVEKLNDNTMVLRPKYANVRENAHGECSNDKAVMMYRDAGIIRTSSRRPATGTYALSLYDLFYDQLTCVMVSVRCDRRSITKFWFDVGFKADNLEDIIKIVPKYKRGQTIPPKILFLTDTFFNYEKIPTSNLVFKFEFTGEATINVDFYGTLITTTPTTTTIKTTTRKRMTYRTFTYSTYGMYFKYDRRKNFARKRVYHRKKKYRTKKQLHKDLDAGMNELNL